VVEAIRADVAQELMVNLHIPVTGIGAGAACSRDSSTLT
jgi:ketopantoate hydroxymethyltransferase